MNGAILSLILGALLPVLITISLGYFSAYHHDFVWRDVITLNRVIILYTLPLSLFCGLIKMPLHLILQQTSVAMIIAITIVIGYVTPLLAARYLFKRDWAASTLQALAIDTPAVPLIGISILGYLFQATSPALIAICALIQNIPIFVSFILLSIATGKKEISVQRQILETLKKPLIWGPLLALCCVLFNIKIPNSLQHALSLLGDATCGIALFCAGIIICEGKISWSLPVIITVLVRNFIMPALLLGILWFAPISGEHLRQIVLSMAIPIGPVVIMIAMQFESCEEEMASSMALSIILSIFSLTLFIALCHSVAVSHFLGIN